MKKHRDLIAVLKSNKMRITPARKTLLQFILDNSSRQMPLKSVYDFMDKHSPGVDKSSIYRNLETFKKLDIIQELNLRGQGKFLQYVFDRKVHPYFICKRCGRLNRKLPGLFRRIERALKAVPGFSKSDMSVVIYGRCGKCA